MSLKKNFNICDLGLLCHAQCGDLKPLLRSSPNEIIVSNMNTFDQKMKDVHVTSWKTDFLYMLPWTSASRPYSSL